MTNQEIKTVGQTIAAETQIGGNTAERVGGVIEGIGEALDNKDAAVGYYLATMSGSTIYINASSYRLGTGGNLRAKMPAAATTACTLTVGNANAVPLWYNGAAVSADNSWEAGEIVTIFYDGTRFMTSNSQGGGGQFGSGEKIKDILLSQALGDGTGTITSQKGVSDAIFNEIDISSIDSLKTLNDALAPSSSLKPTYYTVTATLSNVKLKVGSMAVISDNMRHVVTEIMATHYTLDDTGTLTNEHSDAEIFFIYRSVKLSGGTLPDPAGTWTKWRYVNSSVWSTAAEKIKYDNTTSGLAADNVQEALDGVVEELISYAPIYDDDKFSFSTTSSAKSAYYLRAIPFVQGGIYRLTFTLDDVKKNNVDLYLANSSNRSATGLKRIRIGTIKAGSNTEIIDYTCNDATMIYPSINCAAATSGRLSILVEEQVHISTEIDDVQENVKSLYITKDVEVNASDGFEIAGYNISSTTWTSDTKRKIQMFAVKDCDSVTITALNIKDRNASYSFITKNAYGTSAPVYYCKGYSYWVNVPYGETVTVDVPELAKYIIIYKDYGGTVFFPAKLVFHKRVNPTEEISGAIDFAENAVDKRIDGAGYSVGSYTIDNASPSKWADSDSNGAKSRIVPLKAGRYTLRADNGIGIYAILKSADRIHGEAPDWADGFRGRLQLNYGQSTTIELSSDSYLWCRHDTETPNPAGNRMLAIIPEVPNSEFLQEQLSSHNKPLSTIIVAASNSTSYDKARADIVCTGTDDNKSIETAISMIGGAKGTVYLCRGTYYVTSFTEDTDGTFVGIRIPGKDSSLRVVNIEGYHWGGVSYQDVRIVVDQTTYDSLDSNKNYSVIRHAYVSNGYNLNYRLALRHIGFTIYSNQKKITVIDCSCTSQIVTEDINGAVTTQPGVWGTGDDGLDPIPSLDCVFFRGLIASGNAWSKLKDTSCCGYGIGMGIQGEHLISESCGAINCFYGFTFNYFDNYRANGSMNVHPMIVINPIEEGCLNYPYFGDNPQKQSIIIQGYHNEHRPKFFNQGGHYATEKTPGQWYGHVDYVIQNFPDSHSHGSEMHAVEIPFWAAGSGVNMESVNMVHRRITTSAIRRGYAPNYAQQIFDTTANKLLICTDPANKTWVDVSGNVVE